MRAIFVFFAASVFTISVKAAASDDAVNKQIASIVENARLKAPGVKPDGCLKAEFIVNQSLPPRFRVGVFAGQSYAAWLQFAADDSAVNVTRARTMAIKLIGVSGKKLLPGEESAVTQDFVLRSSPVYPSDDAADYVKLLRGAGRPEGPSIASPVKQVEITDPLNAQYWTPFPYRFGDGIMKYMAKPCRTAASPKPSTEPNYLHDNMKAHAQRENVCFDFYVQLAVDEAKTPLDKATVPWSAKDSPFMRVGRVRIARGQNIDALPRVNACEDLTFSGWHTTADHEPLGSFNQVEKVLHKRSKSSHAAKPEPTTLAPDV